MNIHFFAFEFIMFIISFVWLVFLPGLYLLKKTKAELSLFESLIVSLPLGTVFFTLLFFILGFLKISSFSPVLITIINLHGLFVDKQLLHFSKKPNLKSFSRFPFLTAIIIVVLSLFMGTLLIRSGVSSNSGYQFTEYRDSFWHLGLMKELIRDVPPLHPGFSPLSLTNYHYFTHLFGAGFLNLPFFNDLDFYFRLFPLFLSFLYLLTLFLVGKTLTGSSQGGNLAVLFGSLTGSFAYLLPLFIKYPGFSWHESSFWLSQPFSMVINPSFALSSSLMLTAIFFIYKIMREEKNNLFIPAILLSGTLIVFKVYAGLLLLSGLFVAAIWLWLVKNDFILFKFFFFSLLLSLFLFIPSMGHEAAKFLVFLPGWFLRSMVESPDRMQIADWILREETYREAGNVIAIIRLRMIEFLIYLVGNSGIRIIGIIFLLKNLRKLITNDTSMVATLTIFFLGFLVPLLFVQDGSIANTLQFSYYALEISSLYLIIWLTGFLKNKTILFRLSILAVFLFLAVPTSIRTWSSYVLTKNYTIVTKEQMESFNFIKNNTPPKAIIIVPATDWYTNSLVAGTLSNRRIFYSDRLMAENTHKNFRNREAKVNRFFQSRDTGWNTVFLKDNRISYVYVDKKVTSKFDERYYPLKKVFSNEDYLIYQVL